MREVKERLLVWGVLWICLLCAGVVAADEFVLRDGRTIEGTIVYEGDAFVSIRTASGVITVERAEIREVRRSATVYDEFLRQRADLRAGDLDAHLQLSQWCADRELFEESLQLLRVVLSHDLDHAEARLRLGFVRIRGGWYIAGSPEAQAAQAGPIEQAPPPPLELPEDFSVEELRRPARTAGTPRSLTGSPGLLLEVRESQDGKSPPFSVGTYELTALLHSLTDPIHVTERDDARYRAKLEVGVQFQRTHYFYGKIPVSHIFEVVATLVITDTQQNREVVRLNRLRYPFSGSARRQRSEMAEAGYHYGVRMLMHTVSRHGFFKQRGATEIPAPSW